MTQKTRNLKGLWLTVPLALAALLPLLAQVGEKQDEEPVRIEASGEPRIVGSGQARPERVSLPDDRSAEANPQSPAPRQMAAWQPEPSLPSSAIQAGGSAELRAESEVLPNLDCVIEPWEIVEVRSSTEARIQSIAVDRSDYVEAGQALVTLESDVEAATVKVARARAEMEGEIQSREASLHLGLRRKDRMEALFEKSAISAEVKEEVETDARLAEFELQAAREKRQVASLELEQAKAILNRRIILSPVSGYVVERRMSPGEVVDQEVILTVAQVDPLRVEVIAPSSLWGSISEGMGAEVIPELPPGTLYEAKVSLVDRVMDAASGTFGVRLELANQDHGIPGGLRCRVRFLPDAEE